MSQEPNDQEKQVFMQMIICDLDYIAARSLFAQGLVVTGARLANEVIERCAKALLWSLGRDDLVAGIKSWGGNMSHDIIKIIDLLEDEGIVDLNLNDEERKVLSELYNSYRSRFADSILQGNISTDIGFGDITIVDKVVHSLRENIVLHPKFDQKMIIELLQDDPQAAGALTVGRSDAKHTLKSNNQYF